MAHESGSPEQLFQKGVALVRGGRPKAAVSALEEAARHAPARDDVWTWLGHARRLAGDLAGAEAAYRAAVDRAPENAQNLTYLAAILIHLARPAEALPLARRAVERDEQSALAHLNLGNALAATGEPRNALPCLQKAVELGPRDLQAWHSLGNVARVAGRPVLAERAYRQGLKLAPNDARLLNSLAVVLRSCSREPEAASLFRKAFELTPDAGILASGVQAFLDMGDTDAAERFLETGRQRARDAAEVLCAQGSMYQDLGRFEKAVASFRESVKLDPSKERAWAGYMRSRPVAQDDPMVSALADQVANPALPAESRGHMALALGKAFDDQEAPDSAFAWYTEGHRLRAEREHEGADPGIALMEHLKTTFTASLFGRFRGMGHESTVPVLIVGMPRSGTTLVEQILASHAEGAGAGELGLLSCFHDSLPDLVGSGEKRTEALARLDQSTLHGFAEEVYLPRLRVAGPEALRISDKLPHNFLNLGVFALLFPNARVVPCRRDPVDTCISIYGQDFARHPYAHDLSSLGRYYRAYEALMNHWHDVLSSDTRIWSGSDTEKCPGVSTGLFG